MSNANCNQCLFQSNPPYQHSLQIFKQIFQYAANNPHVLSCFSSIGYDELINIQNIVTSKYKIFKNTNDNIETFNIDDHISKISHMESSHIFSSFPIYCSHRKNRFILCNLFQNPFLNIKKKMFGILVYSYAQKLYNRLQYFSRHIKLRKSKNINTNMNLCGDAISEKFAIRLYSNNSLYVFHCFELMKIMRYAITYIHSEFGFYPAQVHPKNPYTNLHFTKTDLYNIYFQLKEKQIIIPTIIHLYFENDFALKKSSQFDKYFLFKTNIYMEQVSRYIQESTYSTLRTVSYTHLTLPTNREV